MKIPYKSRNPSAGVATYEILPSGIILEFANGKHRYLYDDTAPGAFHVACMKRFAALGKGLTTYINQHVREHYARKLPLQPSPFTPRNRQQETPVR